MITETAPWPQDPSAESKLADESPEEDLWFLPGPMDDAEDDGASGPRDGQNEAGLIADWRQAEAAQAARLARLAGRIGALDERVRRGPVGWRHRLALIEAAALSWSAGDRVSADRLALWISLRLAGVQEDTGALARGHWAVRRLTGGPGPEDGLTDFLGRHEHGATDMPEPGAERIADRADSWLGVMRQARDLHAISRACMGYHLWGLAGLGSDGNGMEAAVTAARIMASGGSGAVFAPLGMGGAGAIRPGGDPAARLSRWIDGVESATLTAMRHLDDIEDWSARASVKMARLSGRTPPALRHILTDWPLVSAPMAEELTGASRAAVQRNLAWMEAQGLIREVTGQGRFRMWRAALR